jgi:MSHA biogenesis protein MshK
VRRIIALLFVACALAQTPARAQSMNDPMRPPDASGAAGAPSSSGLQAVITSPRRKLALIDGAVVPLGAAVRGATLAGVSDSMAVLKKNGARDVLLMHPNIDKRPARRERP